MSLSLTRSATPWGFARTQRLNLDRLLDSGSANSEALPQPKVQRPARQTRHSATRRRPRITDRRQSPIFPHQSPLAQSTAENSARTNELLPEPLAPRTGQMAARLGLLNQSGQDTIDCKRSSGKDRRVFEIENLKSPKRIFFPPPRLRRCASHRRGARRKT